MNKQVILAAIVAVVALAAALMFYMQGRVGTGAKYALKIATLQGGISTLDILDEMRLGERYGLQIRVIRFQKTPDIATALAKGEVDVAIIPAEVAARIIENGASVKIIAVDMLQNQAVLAMSPSLKSPSDLKGKKVGVVTASGTYKMFKAYMAVIYGLKVYEPGGSGDVEAVNVPPGSLADALQRGDVDAIVAWEPIVSEALGRGAHIVADYLTLWKEAGLSGKPVMLVWVARSSVSREALRRLVEARAEAAKIWVSSPDKTRQIIVSLYRLDPKVFDTMYRRTIIYQGQLDNSAIKGIRSAWWLAWKGGYLPENPDSIPDSVFEAP